jgi:hypothetical protein
VQASMRLERLTLQPPPVVFDASEGFSSPVNALKITPPKYGHPCHRDVFVLGDACCYLPRVGPCLHRLESGFVSWDFDCFVSSPEQLESYVVAMFHQLNIPHAFKISDTALQAFVSAVRSKYHDNPFHNFFHAFSVLHAVFMMLIHTQAGSLLTKLDVFATLVAAFCHDIDHPGHNNAYEVNSVSELALRHNDDAVLERHHAHTAFTVILSNSCDLFGSLSREDRITARKLVRRCADAAPHWRRCVHAVIDVCPDNRGHLSDGHVTPL